MRNLSFFRLRRTFTLIELLVAMAVFSVLMLTMFDLFGQVQEIWRTTSARIEVYDKARLFLEIVSRDFEGAVSPSTPYKFYYKNRSSNKDNRETETIALASATRLSASKDCISRISEVEFYYTGMQDNDYPGKLFYRLIGDDQRNLGTRGWNIFSDNPSPRENPFDNNTFSSKSVWKPNTRETAVGKYVELIDCVSEFKFFAYTFDQIERGVNPVFVPKELEEFNLLNGGMPDFVLIEVCIVDRPNWDKAMRLKESNPTLSKETLDLNGRRFMRLVHLKGGRNLLDVTQSGK